MRNIALPVKLLSSAFLVCVALAQPDVRPRFDVAEVIASKSDVRPNVEIVNGQLRMTGMTMRRMITMAYAYTIREGDLRGGPRWLDSDRFDVVAKATGASEPTVFAMLQTLLADRFRLKTHLENEPRLVYVLSVADTGSKLRPATHGERSSCTPSHAGGPEKVHVACASVTMGSLARRLPFLCNLDLPVVDVTELTRTYDFALDWTWEAPLDPGLHPDRPTAQGLDRSIERLGLILDRRKHPMPVIVVDSVERQPIE